ncbi:MAG: matrixin family metalloprotease, partial [Planctomycetota bacterium]
ADNDVTDLREKSWFELFDQSYQRWASISGISFQYEPNDDGVPISGTTAASRAGQLGVRADMRLAGHFIDGQSGSNTLAYNYFPSAGDMVIDTSNTNFYGGQANNYRRLRNVVMHEVGHGLGFSHVESSNSRQLMEPFVNTTFDGPQLDDILAAQSSYGDAWEKNGGNDAFSTATSAGDLELFGSWSIGADADFSSPSTLILPSQTDFISIDDRTDVDYLQFTASDAGLVDFRLKPVGPTYNEGPQNGSQSPLATSELGRLSLSIFNEAGQQVASQIAVNPGQSLVIQDILAAPGQQLTARVGGLDGNIQLYRLDAALNAAKTGDIEFDLTEFNSFGSQTLQATVLGVGLTLAASNNQSLLANGPQGLGVVSTGEGILDDADFQIDGSLAAPEAILLAFDQDVLLGNLQLDGLAIGGIESAVLSHVSGPNPFEILSGYDGPYSSDATSIRFASPDWQSGPINMAFGVAEQSPLLVEAGAVLSLTSLNSIDGGFAIRSLSVTTVVPEPASFISLVASFGVIGWRRHRVAESATIASLLAA